MGWLRDKWNHPDNMMRHHPGNISMDSNQAGATMASRKITAKYATIIGASVFPAGKLVQGGRAVTGSQAYKVYGYAKRPFLSIGVHHKIRGATTAMSLSKAYSKSMIAASVLNFGRNIALARAREWKRLGINVFGPPGSLFLYDNYMEHNMDAEAEIAAAKSEQSRIGSSLPSKPKTRGKDSYRPKEQRIVPKNGGMPYMLRDKCKPGYRYDYTRKLCVRR